MTQTLKFKNVELVAVGNLLGALNLKSKASRGRSKLLKLIVAKNEEYAADRKEALEPYFEDGQVIKAKEQEARKVAFELENEAAVITITEYVEKLKSLYEAIKDYPYELKNQDATAYDLLMDQLEENFEGSNENGN